MSTSPTEPRTLVTALYAAPPERPFVTLWIDDDEIEAVTFGQFTARAEREAAGLAARGVGAGDTVVIVMQQGIAAMAVFAGALIVGAVPAFLAYPSFKVEPAKYRAGLAGVSANLRAHAVVVDADFPAALLSHVTVGDGAVLVHAGAAGLGVDSGARPQVAVDPEALAFIQHSAGTTGLQKGVALTHAAVLRQIDHLAAALHITADDRIYSWLPLYHDMGLVACFMLPLVLQLPLVMQSPTAWVMQPGSMLRLVAEHRATLAWVPNFALQFLARRVHPDDIADADLSSLRALVNCSEPVRAKSMDEMLATFGPRGLRPEALQTSYAMAETVFAVTQSDPARPPARTTRDGVVHVSSGRCIAGAEVRIELVEHDLGAGVGEIVVRCDCLFEGYWNRPDLTAKVLADGWYHTGDLGFVADGELYVVGRSKDLVIIGGKNIHPQDVEEIACAHPAVHDGRAVAFGVLDDALGTEDLVVVAEVDDEAARADAETIERAVRAAIVAELGVAARAVVVKPPRWIVKSTAGKPARAATRDKLLAEHPELRTDTGGSA